jgi:shikimate dehydrogenase
VSAATPAAIRGTTRLAAVLGSPIAHSRSPELLNAAFAAAGVDAVMVPLGVAPEDLGAAIGGLRAMRALGASVTVPHKLAAAALCDELSPSAREIGAVNCLGFDGARIAGHNTDASGFVDGLAAAGFDPRGARAVLLGAGGAARAVAYGLRAGGAGGAGGAAGAGGDPLTVIARDPDRVTWAHAAPWTDAHLRAAFASADLVVDCTPAGLGDDEAAFADSLPLDALRPAAWVASLIYHRRTILLERASARDHSIVDGRAMLVHQGARAFTIWTGQPAPLDAMTRALDAALDLARTPSGDP